MAQRLLRIILPTTEEDRLRAVLEEEGAEAGWAARGSHELLAMDVVLDSEGNDPLLDALEGAFGGEEGFRMLVMPISASLPRVEEDEEEEEEAGDGGEAGGESGAGEAPPAIRLDEKRAEDEDDEEPFEPGRVSRAELYVRIEEIGGLSTYHVAMVALSTIIACVGLVQDSSAVVVGAMVIAPVIGPSMALSLATTLGDLKLGRDALITGIAGFAAAFLISALWGLVGVVDLSSEELLRASRTGYPELLLALAAGSAGVLSVSRGASTALVGVMVAVALLPPAVAAGLLFGAGLFASATRALTVVASNLICINLAGVATFLAQGVRPRTWWEEDRARRAVVIALVLWGLLLAAVVFIISRIEGDPPAF